MRLLNQVPVKSRFSSTPLRHLSFIVGVVFCNLSPRLSKLHRRVRCLAIDRDLPNVILSSSFNTRYSFELAFQCHRFEVNQHPVSDVMLVLLKSGQSASQEKAVEEMKDCRSTTQHWCRSTVMPEYGLSIFYDR
ncbi:hypothetical protein DY000_02040943 [Brassica cretica]|uniref:Uncharacterized protein n=1 Tax=Brassica cretica TaxID=69181 RepID=A0ABQ7BNN3_BRACR|nr:hypothetical protein DY000_02040943 [Brassica cretica]